MLPDKTNGKIADPYTLALLALGWLLSDERRADRLLSLTGLNAEGLRQGVGDPAVLDAVLGFLESHEPDLVACAEAIGASPSDLVNARRTLGT
jgi:hypothetical protein